jgi:hypothetical protein
MLIILRFPALHRVEALLLSASPDRLRVVARNLSDTLDLRRVGDQWFSDRGSPVEIESLLTNDPDAVAQIWHEAHPRTGTAAC